MSNEIEGAMPPLPEPDVLAWLEERRDNCRRIAKAKTGPDAEGWLEDAGLFEAAHSLIARVAELQAERDRIERNRDMWKGQCERQAAQLTTMRAALQLAGQSAGFQYMTHETRAAIDAAIAAKD